MTILRTILVATDLRERSAEVLRAAGKLAEMASARLHVLHAFDLPAISYCPQDQHSDVSFQGRIEEAQRELKQQIAEYVPAGVAVTSDVVIYVAHKAVLEHAAAVSADLIVLGTHRARPVGDAFLGSTADRVVRTSDVPCLVVRGSLRVPLQKVLVPTDMSPAGEGALDVALRWTDALCGDGKRSDLTVLHVVERSMDSRDEFERTVVRPEIRRIIDGARSRAGDSDVQVREEVRWASTPVDEIGDFIRSEDVDLVVIATHGHGAVKRALVGGVATGVARVASCSVLMVPPKMWSRGEG